MCLAASPGIAAPAGGAVGPSAAYVVTPTADLATLDVVATFTAGLGPGFAVDTAASAFVTDVALVAPNGAGVAAERRGGEWVVPACARAACRIRYRVALGRAADALDDVDVASRQGDALVAPPPTWLLHATRASRLDEVPYELRVVEPPGASFLTGLPTAASGALSGTLGPELAAPYAVFGRFRRVPLTVGGPGLTFAVATPALERDVPAVRDWVERGVRAVSVYYGRFPVARALIATVQKADGVHGKEMGGGRGASVLLEVAPGADLGAPAIEWMATHELVHLAVPNMARAHTWLTEGLATYVEPIARVQAGELPAARVWRDALAGMPNGLPAAGDRGLDRTPTWGRTYWGGALFFLVADVEITRQTEGRQSLQSGLRGALAEGADTTVAWTPERFFAAADRAIGKPILVAQYRQWATHAVAVDLDALWKKLGVIPDADGPRFDDHAAWAWIRQSVTRPRATSSPR